MSKQKFFRHLKLAETYSKKINENVSKIKAMVDQLGTQNENSEVRENIKKIQQETNKLSKDTENCIKKIEGFPKPDQNSEKWKRKDQIKKVVEDFKKFLNDFETVQQEFARREKEAIARARAASESYDDSGNPFVPGSQEQAQTLLSKQQLEDIEERQKALQKLERDIMDVYEVSENLATMLEEQGEVISSIEEAYVVPDFVDIESGTKKLGKANKSAKSRREKIIICSVVGGVVLIIIIVAIALSV